MANGARSNGDPDPRPVREAQLSARLRRLGEQLGKRGGRPPQDDPRIRSAAERSAMARGLRLSSELVAGVLVGAGIGWLIDRWLGISPFGLIVFLLLGFAAGVVNVIRAAGVGPGVGPGERRVGGQSQRYSGE